MMYNGYVTSIAIHRESGGDMSEPREVSVSRESGLQGDFRGRGGKERKRQVTILPCTGWVAACSEIRQDLYWTARRANLLINTLSDGIEWAKLTGMWIQFSYQGRRSVILEITGELTPCDRMDAVCAGLQLALKKDWRGGITCRVIRGGMISCWSTFEIVPPILTLVSKKEAGIKG